MIKKKKEKKNLIVSLTKGANRVEISQFSSSLSNDQMPAYAKDTQ